jgi:hypothetical protein
MTPPPLLVLEAGSGTKFLSNSVNPTLWTLLGSHKEFGGASFVLTILFSSSWIHLFLFPFMSWLFLLWIECHIVCMINMTLKLFCNIERMNVLYSQLPMEAIVLQFGILSSLEVGALCIIVKACPNS